MAFIVHMNIRYNLTRTLKIANKLTDINMFTGQQVRHLPRWAHRRPVRIVNQDTNTDENVYVKKLKLERESVTQLPVQEQDSYEIIELEPDLHRNQNFEYKTIEKPVNKIEKPVNKIEKKSSISQKGKKERKEEMKKEMKMKKLQESAAKAGVPLYTKLSSDDPTLSKYMVIAKSKNTKSKKTHILLEGKRLIKDIVQAGYLPQVFFSRVSDVADLCLPDEVKLYKVPYKQMELWSDLSTPPGVLGILETPDVSKKKPEEDALPITIICDNVRDPGNLGSILRAAAGVGCHKLILTKGCVDLWEPKVLRSGSGTHFRTPIVSDVDWEDVESYINEEASVFLADSSTDVQDIPIIPYFAADFRNCSPITLIIGGETEGLSDNTLNLARARAGLRLHIPLCNGVNSLNSGMALGIITFEIKRQFLTKMSDKHDVTSAQDINIQAHAT